MKENIISIILDELDLNQSKLAEIIFTSRQNISRWMDGNYIADEFKIRLSKLTGIPIKYFVNGVEFDGDIRESLRNKMNRISERIRIIKSQGERYYDEINLVAQSTLVIKNNLLKDDWIDLINCVVNDNSGRTSFNLIINALSVYSLRNNIDNYTNKQQEQIRNIIKLCIEMDDYTDIERTMKKILEEDNEL